MNAEPIGIMVQPFEINLQALQQITSRLSKEQQNKLTKMEERKQKIKNNMERKNQMNDIDLQMPQNFKDKVLISKGKRLVSGLELFQKLRSQPDKKQTSIIEKFQQEQNFTNHRTVKLKSNNSPQSSLIESTQNPQNFDQNFQPQKNARQIFIELQEYHRKRNFKEEKIKLHQSLDIKQKIRKLNPSKSLEKEAKNKKEAQNKIQFNIEFLQRLKLQPQRQKHFFKSKNKMLEMKNSERFFIKNMAQKTAQKHQHKSILIQNPLKLPPVNNKCIKQKPYSIYNIYQRNGEIFTNNPGNFNWQ